MRCLAARVLSLLLVSALAPRPSLAAFIEITGTPGADGAAGASGDPGEAGTAGGVGEPVVLDSPSSADYFNEPNATGGAGGAGGAGGNGVPAGASAGNGGAGGAGGAATTTAASDGSDRWYVNAIATGGAGGAGGGAGAATGGGLAGTPGAGGAGGAADAFAHANSLGTGNDSVAQAIAIGGAGGASQGIGGAGGGAVARAEAYSEDTTASAHASQIGGAGGSGEVAAGRGHDSFLTNAVTGDTGGELDLSQYAEGGAGGTGPGSRGGDARSVLTYERDSGLYGLSLDASAQGGAASSPDGGAGLAARGGDAEVAVEGRDHLGQYLQVAGYAYGGNASGPNSQGGTPTLSVHAVSTAGGAIYGYGQAYGGGGAIGGSIDLFNAVTGETTGDLYLNQYAGAGYSTEHAGSASSRLQQSGGFTSLSLTASASGGYTLENEPAGAGVVADALGFAESIAHNTSGSASAEADGYGGGASTYPFPTLSDGGDGEAHASATTEGDGHGASSSAYAYGGWLYSDGAHRGGDAFATATSVALGDSEASAYSSASSGGAGSGNSDLLRSGRARAESTASSAGSGAVVADAEAYGNFDSDYQANDLSPVSARSIATGNGAVTAHTIAVGALDSDAHATAHSSLGAVSSVDAHVTQLSDQAPVTALGAQAAFRKTYFVGNADFWTEEGIDSLGYVNALPVEGEAQDWSVGNPTVAAALGASNPLAVGLVRADGGVSADFKLDLATGAFGPGDVLSIGFVDVKVPDSGFAGVHIDLVLDGKLVQLDFGSAAETLEGLSDDLVSFNLPSPPTGPISLEIHYLVNMLQTTPLGEVAFESRFVVFVEHVPEPVEALLLTAALIAIACARVRVSRATR